MSGCRCAARPLTRRPPSDDGASAPARIRRLPLPAPSEALSGARVLILGDDPASRHALAASLAELGPWLTAARSGTQALDELDLAAVDLVLLDGVRECGALLRAIRGRSEVAVIALLDDRRADESLAAFDAGADDCVPRSADLRELARRVDAVLRRTRRVTGDRDVLVGPAGVMLRPRAHEATVRGVPLPLTPREFDILRLFLERRGEVLSADELSRALWGHHTLGSRNFVEAHISRLRAKLRTAGADGVITTVRGVGYKVR